MAPQGQADPRRRRGPRRPRRLRPHATAAFCQRDSRRRPSTPQEAFRSGSTAWRCFRSSCSRPGRSCRKRRLEGSPPRWSSAWPGPPCCWSQWSRTSCT